MRLLIAEDDPDLREALTAFLEKNMFSIDSVDNGRSAYEYAASGKYDGIILDIMMPKMTGIEVLTKLRQENIKTPVMMLTAKGQKDDRILGFDSGADDYLPKPFAPDELISRLRAILRRSESYIPAVLKFGNLKLDPAQCTASTKDGHCKLSNKEYRVLEMFLRSPNIVISADRIMENIWGWDTEAQINVVWVHISNIRKKLKSINSSVNIYASRGLGYILVNGND